MNKLIIAALGGIAGGVLLSTQVAGPLIAQEARANSSVYEQLDLFGDIFERIRANYVEEVDEAALIEAAINGMLTSLDPHSGYLPPSDFDDMQVQTRGEFGGLGIEVTQEDGFVRVITPMDDTPAMAAGVEAGDFITHVDGEALLGLTLEQAVDLMRGPVGSEITITVVRETRDQPFDITIVRDRIRLTAVRARLEGNTAIVRVSTFNDQTYPNLQEGLRDLIAELGGLDNLNGVVLDLRNNPGGLLNQAIRVSDAFLEQGEIVSTRGRRPEDGDRYNATPGDLIDGRPLVVLVNGGSASASEIVAGALQDHRRAVIVGTNSFGKGSVQSIMPLAGEGAMRLTTSLYYTPSGRSIQALGIAPDILVEQRPAVETPEDEDQARGGRNEASLRGAIQNSTLSEDELRQLEEEQAIAEATARLRNEDYQLAYAIDILTGLNALGPRGN
ncbi:S41 family peptidase [uncultured Roseicyclus sp.]|uniref:S41 family peptidase n=1 Tax=uncultured Roseicyclus sp. TaxID=543072 RepID=UPI00260EF303|nr:S41 family peptidase [uncultured Roseicyclus sp.]